MAYICKGCSQGGVISPPCVVFSPGAAFLPEYCSFDGSGCDWQEIPDDKAIKIINGELEYVHADNQSEGNSTSQEAHGR